MDRVIRGDGLIEPDKMAWMSRTTVPMCVVRIWLGTDSILSDKLTPTARIYMIRGRTK